MQTQDFEIRFQRAGRWGGGFMVFGGTDANLTNSPVHGVLSLLDIDQASAIAERYPDFYRCSSPGASLAKSRIRSIQVIGASSSVRRELGRVLGAHEDSIASGGDRVCIELEGAPLEFGSLTLRGRDLPPPPQMQRVLASQAYLLAERLERRDCRELLHH